MKTNGNKKSAGQWVRRLFEQSGTPKTACQGKAYFAHRYHKNHTHAALGQLPFSAFFSDANKYQGFNTPEVQSYFGYGPDVSKKVQRVDAPSLNFDKNHLVMLDNKSNLAVNTVSSTRYTVLDCYNETLDTKTFRLGNPNGQVFDYLPGQYITLTVLVAGQEYKRSYSLASTPTRNGNLEITVKRDPNGGVVSNWINDRLKVGDTLDIKGPFGKFTCAKNTLSKILFLAAGSGIVPIMSMLRWLVDTNYHSDVVLLLSFRSLFDIIYSDELHAIAARHHNISLITTLTQEPLEYSQWKGLTGRINKKTIIDCVPDVSGRTVYLCGPDAFMAESKQSLLDLAVPAENVLCESFTVNSPQVLGEAKTQRSIIGRPLRHSKGSYRVRFAKSGKTVTADGEMTLLEIAESAGIAIDQDCRAGSCGECMVKCLKGNIEMTEKAEIADFDRKKGWAYSCCAYPASNVVLDI